MYCIKALNHYACQNGYRLLIFNTSYDQFYMENANEQGEAAIFQLIQYDMLDAMVLFSETLKDEPTRLKIVENCQKHQIPVLSIDLPMEGCINFSFDYSNSFEKLCRHIVEDHHAKRVFMMAGLQNNRFSEERVAAFRGVLKENHIPLEECLVGYGDFWYEPTRNTLENWFEIQKLPIPDAIICANDTMAIVTSQYLQDRGYQIPKDCMITGFDGILQSSYHIPHLTTCTQDYDAMGRALVEAIEKWYQGETAPQDYVIGFHIIYSQSCGCKDMNTVNINQTTQQILDRLQNSKNQQDLTCQLQTAVTSMTSISELPQTLEDKFVFHTMTFAVNENIFQPPTFGAQYRGDHAFSENVHVLYHRCYWEKGDPCIIPHQRIAPQLEQMLQYENPIVCYSMHLMDLVLGYCVFQADICEAEYEKMQSFMNAIDSSLGIYHSQLYVKSMNMQLKSANSELEKLYIHDHMTGLLNRRGFYRQFRQQMEENMGKNLQVVLISADLDELKKINDTYGHIEGDNAIATVGRALVASAIQGEVCARFGGDEFTVAGIVSNEDVHYFDHFCDRFRAYLAQYNRVSKKPYQIESSIGSCTEPLTKQLDLDQMSKIADDAMYRDKTARKKNRR